jgi:hypothetical protein
MLRERERERGRRERDMRTRVVVVYTRAAEKAQLLADSRVVGCGASAKQGRRYRHCDRLLIDFGAEHAVERDTLRSGCSDLLNVTVDPIRDVTWHDCPFGEALLRRDETGQLEWIVVRILE